MSRPSDALFPCYVLTPTLFLQVIVGTNGSGKSTILKLLARVYDVTEGKILIDGKDIRTLRLHDLHRAMSVLYQDYTHFQLSVSECHGFLSVFLTHYS